MGVVNRFILRSEADTRRFATALAQVSGTGCSIGLSGELGAGKTTVVRFFVGALGGASEIVSSPSFTLQHEYRLSSGYLIEHWDLYRVSVLPEDLLEPPSPGTIRLVEWPDRCSGQGLKLDLTISLSALDLTTREVCARGARAQDLYNVLRGEFEET